MEFSWNWFHEKCGGKIKRGKQKKTAQNFRYNHNYVLKHHFSFSFFISVCCVVFLKNNIVFFPAKYSKRIWLRYYHQLWKFTWKKNSHQLFVYIYSSYSICHQWYNVCGACSHSVAKRFYIVLFFREIDVIFHFHGGFFLGKCWGFLLFFFMNLIFY